MNKLERDIEYLEGRLLKETEAYEVRRIVKRLKKLRQQRISKGGRQR